MTLGTVILAMIHGIREVDAYLLCMRLAYTRLFWSGLGGGVAYIYVTGLIGALWRWGSVGCHCERTDG
jgi:hypothetical protein